MRKCIFCDSKHHGRGLCAKHYREWYKKTFPERMKALRSSNSEKRSEYAKRWSKINKEKKTGYWMKAYREDALFKKRHKARQSAQYVTLKSSCEKCGYSGVLERHHPNYDKPKFVITLCRKCHLEEHGKKIRSL
jgi:hypothetical protein